MIFKRKLYQEMLRWKTERNGRSALLVKGARRVGKSTLVEQFAKHEYKSYILLDFNRIKPEINELFSDLSDLDFFFMRLQSETNVTLHERQSVIVFDEVQKQPLARQGIKYFVQDGRYDFIETGSLLTLKKNVKNIVIPSEETRLTLHPMDLDEFLWATGKDSVPDFLRKFYEMQKPLGSTHRSFMREMRLYMLVGGMPQAVDAYINSHNMQSVDEVKREIVQLYDDDFRKIDPSGRASRLFFNIPGQLALNASRYKISSAIDRKTDSVDTIIADMEDSQCVTLAYHANDPNVGLGLSKDMDYYKMFVADTGLFVTLAFWEKTYTENLVYNKLLSDKLTANLGYVYENMVAQMLCASGNSLYYYTFPDGNNHNYEVDFLISHGNKIVPIEVKSSGYKTHKSLDVFWKRYSSRISDRILLYTKDYCRDGATICLPVYFTPFL
ncbi:MAG: ATP-binding protein [Bacteroidales bacterium]|nr:ATP-binding protein [Bacteroidales bacterium]